MFGRMSEGLPDRSVDDIEAMQKLWQSKAEDGKKDREILFNELWTWARGDETKRPNRAVVLDEWLEAVDAVFGECFLFDKGVESSPRAEVAMMVGQMYLSAEDGPDYASAREKYVAAVIELTDNLAKGAQANDELSDEVKTLFKQLPYKVAIVLCVAEPGNDWRPWYPLLTRKVYWNMDQQLQGVSHAIQDVSSVRP